MALPPPRQPEPLIASRPWYIRSQLRLSLPQERRQLHVSAQPRPQRCQKMLNEPLSINFAQQVDVGLFAPAPQLVTDGLATGERPGQLDVDGQWPRRRKSPGHRVGDDERVVQVRTPSQPCLLYTSDAADE